MDSDFTEAQLRRWLALLRRPDQLATPEIVDLLEAHARMPSQPSARAVGRAASDLLVEAIERLRSPAGARREEQLPYTVLKMCFVDGAKLFQAAGKLGLSERQMSRERSRAIALLKAELEAGPIETLRSYTPEPIPTILGFVARPRQGRALKAALTEGASVNLHGPPGVGKTSLVAEVASEIGQHMPVFWYRFRAGVNDSLAALLFEIGEHLNDRGVPELSRFMQQALPNMDVALATRLANKGIGDDPLLMVFDDSHHVEGDRVIGGFIEEMIPRHPNLRIVTIGRHRDAPSGSGAAFAVDAFTRLETQDLLTQLGMTVSPQMAETLHDWTGGIPQLIRLAAQWLKTSTQEEIARGTSSLSDATEVQAFLLDTTTELIGSDDRAVLEAASIFRDRFTDDAVAFVAERTRGQVQDASLRLVRLYVATRSRDGDCSFFHGSVRDYVYARLDTERRAHLHTRASEWYARLKENDEAKHHRELAKSEPSAHPERRASSTRRASTTKARRGQ